MPEEDGIHDAKAHLSALVKQVREGGSLVVAVRGEPVAELRPITEPEATTQTLAERIAELRASGEIGESQRRRGAQLERPVAPDVPRALERFLDDRE